MLSVGFLLLIVLVSGVIAVIADSLGRKVGKKKLYWKTRWFRARPKVVAQVSTFVTGILVSGLTILLVATVSSDVRQWIAEGPAALAELNQTLGQLDQAKAAKEQVEVDLHNAKNLSRRLEAQSRKQKSELAGLNDRTEALRQRLQRSSSRLASVEGRYTQVNARFLAARTRLSEVQRKLEAAQSKVAIAERQVSLATQRLRSVQVSLRQSQDKAAKAEERAAVAASQANEVSKKNLELYQQYAELQSDTQRLTAQKEQAQNDLDDAQRQLAATQNNLVDLRLAIAKMEDDYQVLIRKQGTVMTTSRTQPLVYALGEEIARQSVAANASFDQVRLSIRSLLRAAEQNAIQKGAKANGPYPAAGLFEREDSTTKRLYTTDELIDMLAQKVSGKDESQLLLAVSMFNAFRGEPVSLEMAVAENPLVYRASSVVAESRIDGRRDESTVLDQITEFVSKTVKDKARQDRMVPHRGSESEFGSIPMSELYSLVDRVRAMGRTVRIQAVAEADTRAGDPLKLDFRLK